jgi:curved DNA-binding protein CbpA
MNYYEELGIHRDATTEEIREAYKLVARLLHPDHQREPRLKDLAECQMKRLSEVVAALVNPQERARYDAGLANGARLGRMVLLAPPSRPELLQTVVQHWFWVLLGSIIMGMGVWYGLTRDAPPASAAAESARVPTAPAVAQSDRAPVKKRRVKPAETTGTRSAELLLRDTVREEPEPTVSATAPAPAEAPAEAAKVEQRGATVVQEMEPADSARSSGESRFAGEWLNAADGREADPAGTYPARYVEFRIREESGILAGDYRALHRVADKAISPEVVFRVRGQSPAGNTGKLEWESSAGAKGELELTLRSPNQLQLKWWTTQFGRQEALSSGMAVLMRLKTP